LSLRPVARLDNPQHLRTHGTYAFVQDSWRLRPDLTVNLGLRYEYNSPRVDAEDRANLYDTAPRSLVRAGAAGMPRSGYDADYNNLAPRIGLAWRPGQGHTVVRAGYGFYYDQSSLATGEGLYFNQPYFDLKLFVPFDVFPITLSDPFPRTYPVTIPSSALGYQRDLRTADYAARRCNV